MIKYKYMDKNKFVNGPMNTVRLEGNIGNINKTIYLFMDFHVPVHAQTECDDVRSLDIDKFLVKTFDEAAKMNKNIMYDFFVELNPLYSIRFSKSNYKGRYLFEQTEKLFTKAINIESGRVYQSKEFNNVRLHYADIREYTARRNDHIVSEIFQILDVIWRDKYMLYDDIFRILDGLKIIHSHITFLYNLIYGKNIKNPKTKVIFTKEQQILAEYSEKDYEQIAEKFLYKILKSYTHADVSQIIKQIISNELHNEFKTFFEKLNEMISYLSDLLQKIEPYKDQYLNIQLLEQEDGTFFYGLTDLKMVCHINTLHKILWDSLVGTIGLYLMDLYVLRRILDKDYINHAVVYTGAKHANNYIRILVKYFGFKITNYSYLKDNDLKKAEKIIMKSDDLDQLNELFYSPVLKQCSDLNNFPDLLE